MIDNRDRLFINTGIIIGIVFILHAMLSLVAENSNLKEQQRIAEKTLTCQLNKQYKE